MSCICGVVCLNDAPQVHMHAYGAGGGRYNVRSAIN